MTAIKDKIEHGAYVGGEANNSAAIYGNAVFVKLDDTDQETSDFIGYRRAGYVFYATCCSWNSSSCFITPALVVSSATSRVPNMTPL